MGQVRDIIHSRISSSLISSNYHRTAKVWRNFSLAYELRGHEQAVWAVLAIDEEQVLTGRSTMFIQVKPLSQYLSCSSFRGQNYQALDAP